MHRSPAPPSIVITSGRLKAGGGLSAPYEDVRAVGSHLRIANVNLRSTFSCPKCKGDFVAEEGVIYPATLHRRGCPARTTHLCGTACLLQRQGVEVGHG